MGADRTAALEALLVETESAHGAYEETELNGVYDAEWPRWYAAYAVEHGIDAVIGRPITSDELAELLAASWERRQAADPAPTEPWSASTAREIAASL
jgi:hypothetical protein